MASLFVKIWTLHLMNTKQECCPLDHNIQYSKIQKKIVMKNVDI